MDLATLLDREAIRDLRHAYSAHIDAREFDRLEALFAEDAVCEFSAEFGGDWVGRAAIGANYRQVMQAFGSPFDMLHIVTNSWITLTGPDSAHARWYLLDVLNRQHPETQVTSPGGHASPFFCTGIYEDDYVRRDGTWKFARIKLHMLWPQSDFSGLKHP